jgi:hypothetical protein
MVQRQLDRIRLLSARFHELQGLRVACCGASMAIVVGGYLMIAQPTNNGAIVAMLASFLPFIACLPWLNRYYADNFGRQVWKPSSRLKYLPLILLPYLLVGVSLNARYPEIPSGTPTLVTVGLASIVVAIRDWPWRSYYLGVTAAVAIGFKLSASGGGALPPNLTIGILFVLLGASMVPVGVLDHLLLVKLMKEAREPITHRAAQS